MTTTQLPKPEQESPSAHDFERKLWFDYLEKLNDRSLQKTATSGATTWVLLGVAITIAYKTFPQLPHFLSLPNALSSALVAFVLEVDAFMFLDTTRRFILLYVTGVTERRLIPELARRSKRVTEWTTIVGFLILTFLHVLAAQRVDGRSSLVRRGLVGFGVLLFLIAVLAIGQKVQVARKVSKSKTIPPPEFLTSLTALPVLITAAIFGVIGVLSLCTLFAYLLALGRMSIDWLTPLSAASHLFLFCGILLYLFSREVDSAAKAGYEALERAIVVEKLYPEEIRSRFVDQLLGARAGDWLKSLEDKETTARAKLLEIVESVKERSSELENINEQFTFERRGRAKQLLGELQPAIDEYYNTLSDLLAQIRDYAKQGASQGVSTEEVEIMTAIAAGYSGSKQEARMAVSASATELREKLARLAS